MFRATTRQESVTSAASPRPWLQRSIWREGQIRNLTAKTLHSVSLLFLIISLFGAVLIFGLLAAFLSANPAMAFHTAILNVLFQLAIIALLVFFFTLVRKAWLTWRRWGDCVLSLQTMPAFIGESLQGTLAIPATLETGSTVRCSLGCYRDRRHSNRRVMFKKGIPLWESDALKTVVSAGLMSIPVEFALPKSRPESSWSDPHDRVNWMLTVNAGDDTPVEYEVPVFFNPDRQN